MRRSSFVLATAVTVTVLFAPAAAALGPGGWDHVGVGASPSMSSLDGTVSAINTDNPGVLYAGGNFTSAGGNSKANAHRALERFELEFASAPPRSRTASWTRSPTTPARCTWAAPSRTRAVTRTPTSSRSGTAPRGARRAYRPAPDAPITGNVNALQIIGNTLYVGGAFANGADIDAADYLLACDLSTRAASATVDSTVHAFGGGIYALTADSNGTLYAGGSFINLEEIPAADHVAAYIGGGVWQPMGSGPGPGGAAVDTFVRSLTAAGTDVYVGTDAVNVGGIAKADHVARWDGAAWHSVGENTAGTDGWFPTSTTIDALTHYGSIVIAAGSFQNANGNAAADQIAYFDGTTWRPVGSDGAGNGPLPAHPVALGVTNGQVYAGGNFTTAGGDTLANRIASHALRLPDASIGGTATGHFVGGNVYSSTGAGEVRNVHINRGHSDSVFLQIQNDGLVPASFQLKGTGAAQGFAVHYFAGASNITADVLAGTYSTPSIAPRSHLLVRMNVSVAHSSASSATFVATYRSTSGTPHDAVRAVVHAG